jgi:PAS domain S-box-containing protein
MSEGSHHAPAAFPAQIDGDVAPVDSRETVIGDREDELRGRLAAVVESSDDAIVSKTLEGIITTWNKGAERMFGYTAVEAVGRSITMLMPPPLQFEEGEILRKIRAGIAIEHYQTVRVRKDGTLLNVSLTVSPVRDSTGRVVGVSKIARDVTQHKRAQDAIRENSDRLNLALAAADLGDWDWDSHSDSIKFSPRAAEIFGVGDEANLTRSRMRLLVHPEDRQRAEQTNLKAIVDKIDYDIEYRVIRPDGAEVWVATKGRGIYGSDGKLTRMLGVIQDITRRKHIEAEREQLLDAERAAREQAERVSLLKDEFLATLSHELRTPLNAILGWSQMLQSIDHGNAEVAEGLTIIERNTRLQTQLIEDLLDMSRIISGKMRLDVQNVDMHEVIRAAVASIRLSAETKGIRLQVMLDPHAGPVRGDPARLQQCCWNLLSNAVKFTPRNGAIQVILERRDSHVAIRVVDNGQGISPDFLPYLFERFRQADASTTRRHGGLGIGLSVVKQLVEMHGGKVYATSPGLGHGAQFRIDLPLLAVHADESPEQRQHPGSPASHGITGDYPSLKGITVLAIDDEPDALQLIRRLLENCGATVHLATSACEGLEMVKAFRPDMILSDIGMPDEDGYTFIRNVRKLDAKDGGRTPAAALTAFARPQDRTRALRAGFQSHVSKPVEAAELTAVVASLALRR